MTEQVDRAGTVYAPCGSCGNTRWLAEFDRRVVGEVEIEYQQDGDAVAITSVETDERQVSVRRFFTCTKCDEEADADSVIDFVEETIEAQYDV